jgi:probable HAF family extracellular repeat protein
VVERGSAVGYAINSSGLIVGELYTYDGYHREGHLRAFQWTRATGMQLLSGAESGARGVNDSGQVVGWKADSTGVRHAVLWTLPGSPGQTRVVGYAHSSAASLTSPSRPSTGPNEL